MLVEMRPSFIHSLFCHIYTNSYNARWKNYEIKEEVNGEET